MGVVGSALENWNLERDSHRGEEWEIRADEGTHRVPSL